MPGISLDFGLLIAYFVPGMIILLGLAYIFSRVSEQMSAFGSKEASAGLLLIVSALAIVLGMAISVVRASTIEKSFDWAMPFGLCQAERPRFCSVPRVEPAYDELIDAGKLNAFREAGENEKRPYQFYGNVLLAALILVAGWWMAPFFNSAPREAGTLRGGNQPQLLRRSLLSLSFVVLATVILYPACRASYFRYVRAVEAINNYKTQPPKSTLSG